MKTIGIDLGGDNPVAVTEGISEAFKSNPDIQVVLYKPTGSIVSVPCRDNTSLNPIESAIEDLEKGDLTVFVTATNSRSLLVGSKTFRMPGVLRPGLLIPVPTWKDEICHFIDGGATSHVADPEVFQGWTKVGREYLIDRCGIVAPKIGLLNNAKERADPVMVKIHQSLKSEAGYVGLIEPKDIFHNSVDLALVDGFTGNIGLKILEQVAGLCLFRAARKVAPYCLEAARDIKALKEEELGYDAFLKSPLLGIKYPVFRVHGSADKNQIAKTLLLLYKEYCL